MSGFGEVIMSTDCYYYEEEEEEEYTDEDEGIIIRMDGDRYDSEDPYAWQRSLNEYEHSFEKYD